VHCINSYDEKHFEPVRSRVALDLVWGDAHVRRSQRIQGGMASLRPVEATGNVPDARPRTSLPNHTNPRRQHHSTDHTPAYYFPNRHHQHISSTCHRHHRNHSPTHADSPTGLRSLRDRHQEFEKQRSTCAKQYPFPHLAIQLFMRNLLSQA